MHVKAHPCVQTSVETEEKCREGREDTIPKKKMQSLVYWPMWEPAQFGLPSLQEQKEQKVKAAEGMTALILQWPLPGLSNSANPR